MKTWKIRYEWRASEIVEVEAVTLTQAMLQVTENPPEFSGALDSGEVDEFGTEAMDHNHDQMMGDE